MRISKRDALFLRIVLERFAEYENTATRHLGQEPVVNFQLRSLSLRFENFLVDATDDEDEYDDVKSDIPYSWQQACDDDEKASEDEVCGGDCSSCTTCHDEDGDGDDEDEDLDEDDVHSVVLECDYESNPGNLVNLPHVSVAHMGSCFFVDTGAGDAVDLHSDKKGLIFEDVMYIKRVRGDGVHLCDADGQWHVLNVKKYPVGWAHELPLNELVKVVDD